jgi:hypothetical protein
MTAEQQAEYLKANGWTVDGRDLWRLKGRGYYWELTAAVGQQKWMDRERAKMEAKANGK